MAWLADEVPGSEDDEGQRQGARLAQIEVSSLRVIGEVENLPSEDATATSLGITCEGNACHGMMSVRTDSGYEMEAVVWNPSAPGVVRARVARLNGPAAVDIGPRVIADTVMFADRGVSGHDRLRQVTVQWK